MHTLITKMELELSNSPSTKLQLSYYPSLKLTLYYLARTKFAIFRSHGYETYVANDWCSFGYLSVNYL